MKKRTKNTGSFFITGHRVLPAKTKIYADVHVTGRIAWQRPFSLSEQETIREAAKTHEKSSNRSS